MPRLINYDERIRAFLGLILGLLLYIVKPESIGVVYDIIIS